jgi:hypothetical protein
MASSANAVVSGSPAMRPKGGWALEATRDHLAPRPRGRRVAGRSPPPLLQPEGRRQVHVPVKLGPFCPLVASAGPM